MYVTNRGILVMDIFKNKRDVELAQKELAKVKSAGKSEAKALNAKLDKANARITELEEENKVLAARNVKSADLKVKELDLEEREKLLKKKETHQDDYYKEIEKLEKKSVEAKKMGYKEGYSDGVADGVRKGLEHSADDRRMMAQIAALAAASHNGEATMEIAKQVANGIGKSMNGLPATTRTEDDEA